MTDIGFILLYVEDPALSEKFYARLFGRPANESSPSFVMFAMPSGLMFGLWRRANVAPAATPSGGGELAFALEDRPTVEARHIEWRDLGIKILQPPTALDFGYAFTAADPDGHRLRVFAPEAR